MAQPPSSQSFEWDFLVIDTPKRDDLISLFEFLDHLNKNIDRRQGMITFNTDYKHSSDSFIPPSNEFSTTTACAALVGDSRIQSLPASVHIPSLNSPTSLLLSRDKVFKEIKHVGEDNSIS
ncbi:hypothetical protein O181_045750 [Austropuccinia psidii MF-1]|uniref:Uncharacterized protein n=1 Tax=Austropuccinia psidii MF-1 TaxID=1389203 RepID=A0A9Q3HLH7_9BASI|nr:hypothetical protein [Austropuccinia psidii MF-1]